jgi:Ca2+-binding EF-hand superfamily protein
VLSDHTVSEIMEQIEHEEKDRVNFDEFCKFMSSTLE